MKRLLMSLPYGMAVRNLVCCGVLDECQRLGAAITVLVPLLAPEDDAAVRRALPPDVDVRPLPSVKSSLFVTWLKFLKQHMYAQRTGAEAFQVRLRYRRRKTPVFHMAARVVEGTSDLMLSEQTVDWLLSHVSHPHEDYYRNLLAELKPDAVVITKPGYNPDDLPLIKVAQAAGRPVISVDTTWDNMGSKRPPYILPNGITLWNDGMRQEAVSYYGFRPDSAVVTGGPQFDIFYAGESLLPSRSDFLRSLGLDADRQLIVFTLNNPEVMNPDNGAYVRMILEAIRDGRIREQPNLVVRIHPWDRKNDYAADIKGFPRVYMQRPFGHPSTDSVFECVPSRSDVLAYGALMHHADVLINIRSTTSLDALATDTPIVNIAFDLTPHHPDTSCARFYGYTYYKDIVQTEAVRLTHTPDELWDVLNAYLSDRSLDGTARRRARDRFLTYSDGRSAERVAAAIHAAAV